MGRSKMPIRQQRLQRHVLAEGHQTPLNVVAMSGAQGHGGVVKDDFAVRQALHSGNTQHEGSAGVFGPLVQLGQDVARLMRQNRDRGFGPHQQVCAPVGL